MAGTSLRVTTEVTQKTELNVTATALQMLRTRLREREAEHTRETEAKARKKRIDQELDDILTREGQGGVLVDGVTIDTHRLKLVCGQSSKLNLDKLKRKFGLTQADIDSCKDTEDSTPYLKVTKAGKDKDEDQ